MRVLISGATGFAGRHLAARCRAEGAAVWGAARRPPDPREPVDGLASHVEVDLCDPDATAKAIRSVAPERVFHLAADASVARSWCAPDETLANNLFSSLNLLEAVRRHAPDARVLMASSGEVYGPVPAERLPVTEEEALRPQNPYAASKAAAELVAGQYADAHGLHVVRTRAFNHAGPGQGDAYVVSALARQIAEAERRAPRSDARAEIQTGELAARRDFTDVRDVARAYWLALEHATADVFNVCRARSTAIVDILNRLAEHTALDIDCRTDPARLRKGEVMEIRGSHEKLSRATGWRPEIPLEQTLRDTLDWWRSRLGRTTAP